MNHRKTLYLVFTILFSFVTQTHADMTPREYFDKGISHDKKCAQIYTLILYLSSLQNYLQDTNLNGNPAHYVLDSHVKDLNKKINDPWIRDRLTAVVKNMGFDLGTKKDSVVDLLKYLKIQKQKLHREELFDEELLSQNAYQSGSELNKEAEEPFALCDIFALASHTIHRKKQMDTDLTKVTQTIDNALCAAALAEFGLFSITKDDAVSFIWYLRAAKYGHIQPQLDVISYLVTPQDHSKLSKKALKKLRELVPLGNNIPSLIPALEKDFSKSTIFESVSGIGFLTSGFLVCDLLFGSTHREISTLLSLMFSLGATYYLENYLNTPKEATDAYLRMIVHNNLTSVSDTASPSALDLVSLFKEHNLKLRTKDVINLSDMPDFLNKKRAMVENYIARTLPVYERKAKSLTTSATSVSDASTESGDEKDSGQEDSTEPSVTSSTDQLPAAVTVPAPSTDDSTTEPSLIGSFHMVSSSDATAAAAAVAMTVSDKVPE